MTMAMTMTQKIIAAHCGREQVLPGEIVLAGIDLALANDVTAPLAIRELTQYGFRELFDPEKIVLVMDHFTPNKDIKAAQHCQEVRRFARERAISHFYDVGQMGVEHALLPEQGLVGSGDLIIGADSHTCTYGALGAFATGVGSTDLAFAMASGLVWLRIPAALRIVLTNRPSAWVSGKDIILQLIGRIGVSGAQYKSLEFCGQGLSYLSMDDRFCMANMAIEAGAKNGIFPVDEQTEAYERQSGRKSLRYTADAGAVYEETYELDLSTIRPTVAFPHSPDNIRPAEEAGEIAIDQVVIGSCTNGRLSDLQVAAQVLQGRRVHPNCRVIVIPATQQIYLEALQKGYIATLIEAGCAVSTPSCGPCLGGHLGVLAPGERAVATTNRNFVGRMGHPDSEVYLAGPAVAAASAIAGRIATPDSLGGI